AEGASYARKLEKSEGRIDWDRDAHEIDRQVRALNPWPVAESVLDGEPLRILAGHVLEEPVEERALVGTDSISSASGSIIAGHDDFVAIQCGRGRFAATHGQRPARRAVSARAFSAAHPPACRRPGY